MPARLLVATVLSALALTGASPAAETALQLTITTQSGDFDQRVMRYDCGTETPVVVTYINAAPNFLAIVPLADEAQPLVFAAVISGSGVRYAAGKWIWTTKGVEASLLDGTLDADAEPVLTCSEINNIP
jgi:membrane-bound inhibitor of C-type lysozyme